MTKILSGGKDQSGRTRYQIYLPQEWVDHIKDQAKREDIRGVVINIGDLKVIGYREPPADKHMRFKKKITEVPA